MKKNPIIAGALLLTAAGFLSRILGFFYRIFLSRTIGAKGLGIYQMIFPIHGICFALCAGSIQTAISQMVAANTRKGKAALTTGLAISLFISIILTALIFFFPDFLAERILLEPSCAPLLPVMALSIPFSSIHACICGYYYGLKKTSVPAFSQLIEQIIRIFSVFLIADVMVESGKEITVQLAVWGLLIGEVASALFSIVAYNFHAASKKTPRFASYSFGQIAVPLMALSVPLMGNRLILNVLQSLEAIFIPNRLHSFGLNSADALSVYGVLTGMALPFILFPSAVTNSLAVMLLPTVAEAQAAGNHQKIRTTIGMALRYSLYMGILCIGVFTLFGNALGITVYHNQSAGAFITTLAWLCPFLYLSTTLGSILNGLGRTSSTFLHNAIAILIRLLFVLFGIPKYGILAYLWGMLASELILAFMHLAALRRRLEFTLNAAEMILKPVFCLAVSTGLLYASSSFWNGMTAIPQFAKITLQIGLICASYGGLLLMLHRKNVL